MPLLLYRYILGDLLRVVVLTTVVLVSVIAFGAAVRPMAEEEILAPLQVAKYIGLAIVPMLQFALPFAAGFAATMAFHRMASDNEIVAIAVGGISYPRVLVPVLALGVLLSVIMVGLTQEVIPRFWGLMEQTVTRDVTEIFQGRIRSGQPFTIGDTQIYAEEMIPQDAPPDTGADQRLILLGVAAAELDERGRMVMDVTASRAAIDIYRRDEDTYIKLIMTDTVVFKQETGELMRMRVVEPRAVVVPSVLRTATRAMTREQLLALRTDPEGYATVKVFKDQLAETIFEHELWARLEAGLQDADGIIVRDGTDPAVSYAIEVERIEGGDLVPHEGRPVVVVRREQGRAVRQFEAAAGSLTVARAAAAGGATMQIELSDVSVRDLGTSDAPANQRRGMTLGAVVPTAMLPPDLTEQPVDAVLASARSLAASDAEIDRQVNRLERRIERLHCEVSARLSKRYALSTTAMLLVMLGSILAIWLRHTQPLTIYLLAFVPSILDLILISGGEQMMGDGSLGAGAAVMWSGNAVLVVVALIAFFELRQH